MRSRQRNRVSFSPVPDGKGIDAVELTSNLHAIFHVTQEDHLSVAGGFKPASPTLKILFQFGSIVDFSVVHNAIFPLPPAAHHGLDAAGQIPDGQPGVGQAHMPPQIFPPSGRGPGGQWPAASGPGPGSTSRHPGENQPYNHKILQFHTYATPHTKNTGCSAWPVSTLVLSQYILHFAA